VTPALLFKQRAESIRANHLSQGVHLIVRFRLVIPWEDLLSAAP
jgi:hypothetical protein